MDRSELTLVYRDKREANFSIERLFKSMEPYLAKGFDLSTITVPCQPTTIRDIFKNAFFAMARARGVVHITGDAQYLALCMPFKKTVLTIHDCGYLRNVKGLKGLVYRWLWFTLPCLLANRITVISEATREVLEDELGVLGSKLRVVENCLPEGLERKKTPFNEFCPKILQIGTGRHKNLDNLIKAVADLNCELKIVGRVSADNLEALKVTGVKYSVEFAVSDSRLREIYTESDILFFASRHEGFGLPILEAQQVGLPVITSNLYSMPHVAGDAAIIVDPEDFEAIRRGIVDIVSDGDFRQRLVAGGHINAERFKPENIANQYNDLYRELLPS